MRKAGDEADGSAWIREFVMRNKRMRHGTRLFDRRKMRTYNGHGNKENFFTLLGLSDEAECVV